MKDIACFLLKNGFTSTNERRFENDKCCVRINDNDYLVYFKELSGGMYSKDLNIYWLIGVLTYYDLIDKNYIT